MKVICISQCQQDRKILYKVGEEYDIPKEMYEANKDFFAKVKKENKTVAG